MAKKIIKPEFTEEVVVTLPEVMPITHNVNKFKEFALELKNYYSTVVFTEDEVKNAAKERAKINNFKKAIAELRKKKVEDAKLKLGIADFENICKEAESMVDEAAKMIDSQVKAFEEKDWNDKKILINKIITEKTENIKLEIIWDDKWKQKGYNLDTIEEDIVSQINAYTKDLEDKEKDISIIKRMTTDEKYIERYIHTRDLTSVLDDIDRDKKIVVAKDTVMEKPKSSKNIYTYTFGGTKEQIEALKKYAKEELWMEV